MLIHCTLIYSNVVVRLAQQTKLSWGTINLLRFVNFQRIEPFYSHTSISNFESKLDPRGPELIIYLQLQLELTLTIISSRSLHCIYLCPPQTMLHLILLLGSLVY